LKVRSSGRVNIAGPWAFCHGDGRWFPYRGRMPLVLRWGGPRHDEVDEVPDRMLTSSLLVYDGPRWIGVYEPLDPPQKRATPQGGAEAAPGARAARRGARRAPF
jgi:hypothetical protein